MNELKRETMLGQPVAVVPWYDPRGWRMGRAWQLSIMAALWLGYLVLLFGRDNVLIAIRELWGST
jgi:hypothetical protein